MASCVYRCPLWGGRQPAAAAQAAQMRQFPNDQKQATAAACLCAWPAVVCYVPTPGCASEGASISILGVEFRHDVARQVLASIEYGAARGDYELHAWVIMPNHVHLVLTPQVDVSKALGLLKAGSAKSANLLLGRAGQPFWQDESYDHLVRNDEEFRRIQRYIENHPVTAGLALNPEERPMRPPQAGARPTT